MKVQGYNGSAIKREIIALEREDGNIEITLTALPSSYGDIVAQELPEPIAPLKKIPVRDPDTQKFIKDPVTGGKIFPPNFDDPGYKREEATYNALQGIATIYHALKYDPNIAFDTPYEPESPSFDGKKFYTAIRDEMESFGLNMGDIATLVKKTAILSGVSSEEVKAAEEDFTDLNPPEEMMTDSD